MTKKQKTVAITFDGPSLLRALSKTFSSGTTFVGELLQNARRAGATEVSIMVNDLSLTIQDNGCGISDFDKLLALAQSGWDEKIMAADQPYGLGFLSSIFSCKEIEVVSNSYRLRATSAELQSISNVGLEDVAWEPGTTITMHGHGRKVDDLLQAIKKSSAGFPIPVRVNGNLTSRSSALDNVGPTFPIPGVGTISQKAMVTGNFWLYLQGAPIHNPLLARHHTHLSHLEVLHLDSSIFEGRMPDRAALLDEDQQVNRIKQGLLDARVAWVTNQSKTLDPDLFLETYGNMCVELGLYDILNQFDRVPGEWFCHWNLDEGMWLNSDVCREQTTRLTKTISRAELEAKGAVVISHSEDMASQCFAAFSGAYIISSVTSFGKHAKTDYWLKDLVTELDSSDKFDNDENAFRVEVINPLGETNEMNNNYVDARLVFGESLRLVHATLGAVEIPSGDGVYLSMEHTIYATPNTSSCVVQQASYFTSEHDGYDDSGYEEACDTFDLVRAMLLNPNASDVVGTYLRKGLPWKTPALLKDKTFVVKFDADGNLTVDETTAF